MPTTDLTFVTLDGWIAAAERWREKFSGQIEYIDIPAKCLEQRDRLGEVVGHIWFDAKRRAIVFAQGHLKVAVAELAFQVGVPELAFHQIGSRADELDFTITGPFRPGVLEDITYHSSIPRDAVPSDGRDFVHFLLCNLPAFRYEIEPRYAEAIRGFWDDLLSCINPIIPIEELHEVSGYDDY